MTLEPLHPRPRAFRTAGLALLTLLCGVVLALLSGEALLRVLGLRTPEAGRIFRISNGPNLQYPGRAGHTVIDLYGSNPRRTFPVNLNDETTRERLISENFNRVEEARKTNPFGVAFTYNARGFREREFEARPLGTRRVVYVGDSFTEAQGVVAEDSAVRLVEKSLRGGEPLIEAWNLGVRGQDFPDLEALLDIALELSPDVVVLAMVLNDGDRDVELTNKWPRVNDWIMVRQDTPSWLERHSYLINFVSGRFEQFRVSRDTTAWYQALYSDENRNGWMRTRAALTRFQRKCRERGIAFGVALWPLLVGLEVGGDYPFEAAHAQIRRGVERSGIPFIDLLPSLRGRDSTTLWVHTSDLHPNEVAQALVTPVLADFSRERLLERAKHQLVAK